MNPATFTRPPWTPPVTQLRVGRVVLLAVVTLATLVGGAIWLLKTQARPLLTPTTDSTAWLAWLRQAQTYPAPEPDPPKAAVPAPDPNAALLAKLAGLQAEMERQRQEIEALKKRPSGTTVIQTKENQAAKVTPAPKPPPPSSSSRAGCPSPATHPVRALRCEPAACRRHPALASRWRGACGPTPGAGISGQDGSRVAWGGRTRSVEKAV